MRGYMERSHPEAPFAMMSSVPMRRYLEMSGPAPSAFLAKPFSVGQCRSFFETMLAIGGHDLRPEADLGGRVPEGW